MMNTYLSISELAALLNRCVEEQVGEVCFEGEISQLTRATSGHIYFTIKDEESQLSAVIWRGVAVGLGFQPEGGLHVICRGRPNIYPKSGRLQMIVQQMEIAGEGQLRKRFEQLKGKLAAEGLFAPERKRAIPFFPRAIGVVTSASGAVIHDIMVKIKERMPSLPVYLVDVRVQGDGAAEEIALAIRRFNKLDLVDLLIVGRGGGSLEDLWAFNEEVVVREIFASRLPVISAVGHESDVSLADLVADCRAPTPTAAAEICVPHRQELMQRLFEWERRLKDVERWLRPLEQRVDELDNRLRQRVANVLERAEARLSTFAALLKSMQPRNQFNDFRNRIQLSLQRISAAARAGLVRHKTLLADYEGRLANAVSPQSFRLQSRALDNLEVRLRSAKLRALADFSNRLERAALTLEGLSHRRVMRRGYAVVEKAGRVVGSVAQLASGDTVRVSFWQGAISALVESVEEGSDN